MTAHSPNPLSSPVTDDDLIDWLRLWRSARVGPATFLRLMGEHGTAGAALAALPDVARAAGVKDYHPCSRDRALAELTAGRQFGAQLIAMGSAAYPAALYDIADAPPLLWARGRLDLLAGPAIAIVGARNASSLGTRMARGVAQDLAAAGHIVVSGLARGIDAAAHAAALEGGTIAVLAGGVDLPYPAENTQLYQRIGEEGVLLSERRLGYAPRARDFPRRNRLISGLSRAVVVIEAAARSGSLITARNALDQGREVLAVPGHPFDARSGGCNQLIRDGARLVRHGSDILDALPPSAAPVLPETAELPLGDREKDSGRSLRQTAELHQVILQRLGPSPLAEDQLIRDLDMPASVVSPALTDLEMAGKIDRQAGGLLCSVESRPESKSDRATAKA